MPNVFATLVLLAWPLVTAALFLRLSPGRAMLASLLAGYLLLPPLPAEIDLPLLPSMNKDTIPSLAALCAGLVVLRGRGLLPQSLAMRALLLAYLLSPVVTIALNPEPLAFGVRVLPGLRLAEAPGLVVQQLLLAVPFLLARALLQSGAAHRDLLAALVLAALAYAFPILLELRLSPQLNTWVYGFFQHDFRQMIRGEGYRPIVFLYHGLWVAFLVAMAVLAAVALARQARGRAAPALWGVAGGLWVLLLLCKSMAAILYTTLLAPFLALAPRRLQMAAAVAMAGLALAYPALKGADLVPREAILARAEAISPDRAQSLEFRFDNEDVLLARAAERPLFGWGIWGRNQLYDLRDGDALTVSDGRWIVVIGIFGWVGFLAEFGLLALPVFMLFWRQAAPPAATAALAVMLGMNLVDLLPNATLTPVTFLAAGAILGMAERSLPAPRPAPAPLRTVM
ncbi:hypothetical protein [Limimaricola pyoseonensis]|uniref:O-antigen ligase like membrane protein n=1 Tax=Limimaricola pyoseonensis TaxID=521013 RepID=A0A1G7K2I6_9RHOB|nr:hypothetical protein [Limimaricola pyoseonensis]SDF31496.1 hypothetical protein SAMN04488567_0103 [Limimaricola pyoseonensis]